MKETEEDTKKWKNVPCSWIGRINIVKMSILPKAIYTFNAIPIKIPSIFPKKWKNNPKIYIEPGRTPNSQRNVEKENQSWQHHSSRLQLYYKVVIIKTAWYWHKNRHTDQWNRTESPEIDPQLYGQLIFNKAGKNA